MSQNMGHFTKIPKSKTDANKKANLQPLLCKNMMHFNLVTKSVTRLYIRIL